jgi:D-lyxose ketol-isomerase
MITRSEYNEARQRAAELIRRAGVIVRPEEMESIEVADLGLGELEQTGLQILTILNSTVIAAKLLILLPNQTFAQHRHPRLGDYPGKEETFRCVWGEARLYVPGEPTAHPQGRPPAHRAEWYTVHHEVPLYPGDQYTVAPNTWHWFAAGDEGAVVWSFSTQATDAEDEFTDPQVRRRTVITDD